MEITGICNNKDILSELGNRIQQYRISLNITQSDLAQKCGISTKTVARIESGDDLKFSNLVKILNEFGLLENLNILIPELQPDYKAMFEEKAAKKRARPTNKASGNDWVWGEDERENET